jgi:hypothetical protein
MEFLFLIQNISLEIIILLSSVLLLIIFLIRYLYHEISRVIHALTPMPITHTPPVEVLSHDDSRDVTPDIPDTSLQPGSLSIETSDPDTVVVSQKVDTSQVEKLV